jgi:hypothetical protein
MTRWFTAIIAFLALSTCFAQQSADNDEQNWEEKFNQVYKLREDEVLKHIPTPFISERLDYYRQKHPHQAKAMPNEPDYFDFHWRNEKLENWGSGFGSPHTLAGVLNSVLQVSRAEIVGDDELLGTKLPGDWIVRTDSEIEQKLDALVTIMQKATQKQIQFAREQVDRNVIVVSGTFTAETRDEKGTVTSVDLYVGERDPNDRSGGGSGTMEQFIERLSDLVKMPTALETPSRPIGTMSWRIHSTSFLDQPANGRGREERLRELLDHVTEQTGLEFKIEERQVPVWVVTEDK